MFRRKKKDKLTIEVDVDTSKAEKKMKKFDQQSRFIDHNCADFCRHITHEYEEDDYARNLPWEKSTSAKLDVLGKETDESGNIELENTTYIELTTSIPFEFKEGQTSLLLVNHEKPIDFVNWLKEVLSVKKYQKLAEKYFLEFEFAEDSE